MIRQERIPRGSDISILRLYTNESADPFAPYQAVCTATWERPTSVWISGMCGGMTRPLLLDLLRLLAAEGVETIKAKRADSRSLPRGKLHADGHIEIRVSDLLRRFPA